MDVSLKEAVLEIQAPEQLDIKMNTQIAKEKIESGERSVNEIRIKFGLSPIEDIALTKVQFDNSMELD